MRNRKFWACLMALSLLLIVLAGCQNHDAPDPGTSQSEQIIVSSAVTTEAPDDITEVPDTEKVTDSREDSETLDLPDNTEASTEHVPEDDLPTDAAWLWANRCTLVRKDYEKYSVLYIQYLSFWDYGRGSVESTDYIYCWDPSTGQQIDSVSENTKTASDIFDYTLNGNRLSMTFTHNDVEDYEDYTVVYTIEHSEDDESITFSNADGASPLAGTMYKGWKKNSDWFLDLEAMCEIFGVECSFSRPEYPGEPDTTQPTDSPTDTERLKGDWTTVIWEDNSAYGDPTVFVTKITYSFGKDGTGAINDIAWISRPGAEWEIAGKGYVETYFIYTLEGDTLSITPTGSEFGEYPEEERATDVYTVIRNQDGSITWVPADGRGSRIYRRAENDLTVEELLLLFDLNPNIP